MTNITNTVGREVASPPSFVEYLRAKVILALDCHTQNTYELLQVTKQMD